MSHLSKIVRSVLSEAAPAASEPQSSAGRVQKPMSAAKKAKGENAISPNSYVDPGAFVERSSVGFGDKAADVHEVMKKYNKDTPQRMAFRDVNGIQWNDPHVGKQQPSSNDIERAKEYFREALQGEIEKSQVLGDSAVSDSIVCRGSTVKDSAVSDSYVQESQLSGVAVAGESYIVRSRVSGGSISGKSHINNANLTDCNLTEKSSAGSSTIMYSSLVNSSVNATVPKTLVTQTSMKRSYVTLSRAGSRVSSSKLTNTSINLSGGARDSYVIGADIEDSEVGEYARVCDVVIKGLSSSRVFISNALIRDSATIIATKGAAPQITGYPQQKAIIEGHAKVYDSAHVAGRVSGRAEVFGNAKVEANAHITGNCRVGGTAHMAKGTYQTGEYMEGSYTGGDEENDLETRANIAIGDAVYKAEKGVVGAVKGLFGGGED